MHTVRAQSGEALLTIQRLPRQAQNALNWGFYFKLKEPANLSNCQDFAKSLKHRNLPVDIV